MDSNVVKRGQEVLARLTNRGLVRAEGLEALRECVELAGQFDYLADAVARLRVREGELLEALRKYLAAHNAYEPCACDGCTTARRALRRPT